ncbi:MAG: flavin reductase family protein [Archaeoglobaceae archaeon]|nr:flavin reductase family protein [Archaeoglobaceae archaeon]MCX8152153.1 flavin reductase family protein [Archaeoglobaceae archaeon]MDW8013869.1 flavin reductase family protein [Archaeoglobaceae archaeon]
MKLEALYKISYGLYVVTSVKDGAFAGQIANTVFQVTSEPPKIAACLNKKNTTHEYVKNSKVFSVSVLEKDTPLQFIGIFGFRSSRDFNKFKDVNFKIGKTGTPIVLDYSVAFFEAEVEKELDVGTHTIFVGKVIDAEILKEAEVMTYAYYHLVKRGKTPKTATVYLEK